MHNCLCCHKPCGTILFVVLKARINYQQEGRLEVEEGEPPEYLCDTCYNDGVIVTDVVEVAGTRLYFR